jgi:hypothetical protein
MAAVVSIVMPELICYVMQALSACLCNEINWIFSKKKNSRLK